MLRRMCGWGGHGDQLFYVRLPQYMHIESKPFEADVYRADVTGNGPESAVPELERIRHTVRWRRGPEDEEGEQQVRRTRTQRGTGKGNGGREGIKRRGGGGGVAPARVPSSFATATRTIIVRHGHACQHRSPTAVRANTGWVDGITEREQCTHCAVVEREHEPDDRQALLSSVGDGHGRRPHRTFRSPAWLGPRWTRSFTSRCVRAVVCAVLVCGAADGRDAGGTGTAWEPAGLQHARPKDRGRQAHHRRQCCRRSKRAADCYA